MMGGHRRDQSDSQVPLRQCIEFQQCISSSQDQIGFHTETSINIVGSVPNGTINSISSSDLPIYRNDCIIHRQQRIWQKEALKTCAAFFCLLISAFLNFFLLTVIHDIAPREPLPDLVFMLIPQQRWAWVVGDIFSTLNAVLGFTCVLLHKKRLIVFRRVLLLGGIMYGLRAVVLGVTFLPSSFQNRDEICLPQVNRTAMFVTYVVTLGLTSGQNKILCGDLMFSGHTVVLTIMYFTLLQYTPRRLVYLRYIAAPLTYMGIAALVISGGHYTMDVLIAYWLTSHIFYAYHQVFEMPRLERMKAPLSHLWWFWLCYWFESDVPDGALRNEWDWPLPGPICIHHFIQRISDKLQ
uniref:PAP2_C domain-containing protein n=1 Tax=Onchocerca volvulus TaxID=6282 RepID=A0A8R1XXX7_ONCVO